MLRVELGADDQVLICMQVADAEVWVEGSTQEPCAECDALVWRAPGPPGMALVPPGGKRPGLLAFHQPPTVVLCVRCAMVHMRMHGA